MFLVSEISHAQQATLSVDTHAGEFSWVILLTVDNKNWFSSSELASYTARSLSRCLDDTNAQLLAWVLLPDQLHVLIQAGSNCGLSKALQRIKAYTAIAANQLLSARLGMVGPLWQLQHELQAVYRPDHARRVGEEIIHQPQHIGLVDHYSNYPYWDCIWV